MKVFVYNYRGDEDIYFQKFEKIYDLEIVRTDCSPTIDTCHLAAGCDALSVITETPITAEMMKQYKEMGIRFISTRTIGYEHMDQAAAAREGIVLANVAYSPSSVADYAIMLMLMVLRKTKSIQSRSAAQDYTLAGHCGRELPNLSVGIIGAGKIGATVARHLSGFGCKIYAYDKLPNTALSEVTSGAGTPLVEYVDLDTLYARSDIITLHVPSTPENQNMINRESISKMKDGVTLINTARGDLIQTDDLIEALESGKLYGAALDVIDGDRLIYYRDKKMEIVGHRQMAILNAMPNVLLMPHTAFYTEQAVSDMVEHSLESCRLFADGKTAYPDNPWILH